MSGEANDCTQEPVVTTIDRAIAADLRRVIRGEVIIGPDLPHEASRDFGGLLRSRPTAVIRPSCAQDVADALDYASARGLGITARAAGFSMGGQSLAKSGGGIQLDLRTLNQLLPIEKQLHYFEAGAGTPWTAVIEAAIERALVPPVLTKNPQATLGGTVSVGGLGTSSFRYGSQADNCLALEVALPRRGLVWCSPESNRDLFDHVRAGLGLFGVITRVKHRLQPLCSPVQSFTLLYDNFEDMLAAMKTAVTELRVDDVGGAVVSVEGQWVYMLRVNQSVAAGVFNDLPGSLHPLHAVEPVEMSALEFARRSAQGESGKVIGTVDPTKLHPWIDNIVPWDQAGKYVDEILSTPLRSITCSYAFWPLQQRHLHTPLLITPAADLLLGVSVLPVVAVADREPTLSVIERLARLGVQHGGKRYLSGWLNFDSADWREHFGPLWSEVVSTKTRFDPQLVLNPGLLPIADRNSGSANLPCQPPPT